MNKGVRMELVILMIPTTLILIMGVMTVEMIEDGGYDGDDYHAALLAKGWTTEIHYDL